jgi:hypothetical protein
MLTQSSINKRLKMQHVCNKDKEIETYKVKEEK